MALDIIEALTEVLKARRGADPDSSYVASLYARGLNKMLEKVGEEATEVLLAAKDHGRPEADPAALQQEVADLWFHCMVLLVHLDVPPAAVLDTLAARFGISGHEEKRNRHNA
ncbi:MAG: phosphoribosyl-ATP diphosphatase [Pseudomonadales bacterium]